MMSTEREHEGKKRLFASAGALLEEIETSLHTMPSDIKHASRVAIDDIGTETPGILPPQRGRFVLQLSDDRLQCRIDISPPDPGAEQLAVDDIYKALAEIDVSYGIDTDAIETAVLTANLDGKSFHDLVIARGARPRSHVPEHIEPIIDPERSDSKSNEDAQQDQKVDYRERSPFVFVAQGTDIAKHKDAVMGDNGRTVTGEEIEAPVEPVVGYLVGENIEREGDTYRASIDGNLELKKRTLSVSPVLSIGGNVDYSTGNIDFNGDVHLSGEICDGFSVKATGSILSRSTVYATAVEAGGNITIAGGIIGRKQGYLKAGGDIQTRFIENCRVESTGSLFVKVGIMNSQIFCGGELRTGRAGIIIGAAVVSAGTIRATQVGSESSSGSVLQVGISFPVMQSLESIGEKRELVLNKLMHLQGAKSRVSGEELKEVLVLERRLLAAHEALDEQAHVLVQQLHVDENAEVHVSGGVYPGTRIEICHVSYHVNKRLNSVVFRLDKRTGTIVIEPLKSRSTDS